MICKECGREMPETDKFCGICGTPNPLLENVAAPAQEYVPYTQPDSEPVQEYQPNTQDNGETAQENQPDSEIAEEYRPNPQPDSQPVNEPYQEYPYPQTNSGYRPYTQAAGEPADIKTAGRKAKVKYTCSLTAVIVCVVVIFLLSVACGVFAGLYFSARPAASLPAHSITQYESGGES